MYMPFSSYSWKLSQVLQAGVSFQSVLFSICRSKHLYNSIPFIRRKLWWQILTCVCLWNHSPKFLIEEIYGESSNQLAVCLDRQRAYWFVPFTCGTLSILIMLKTWYQWQRPTTIKSVLCGIYRLEFANLPLSGLYKTEWTRQTDYEH